MKKLLLLLIVITGASQLKAQQSAINPFDQNLFKTPGNQNLLQFKSGDSALFKNFSTLPNGQLLAAIPNKLSDKNLSLLNPAANIDHMPIAKVSGNIDHMPIVKPSGKMEKMPVVKVVPLGLPKAVTP